MLRAEDRIGPYTLIRQLGKGSFGVVWLAERRGKFLTTQVAVKIPIDDEPDLEAIQQEAQSWLQVIGHPNVLPVLDADEYDGRIVIVSEYAPDGSLSDWIRKHNGKAPSVQAAVDMTCGTLYGLEHLHSRKMIHRDLKPGNVLLQGDTPRLTDFGVSRVLQSSGSTRVAGTPAYMAPEMFDGQFSEQTDLWAAGVLLYKMLSGTLPFSQQGWGALYAAIKEDEPAALPPEVPEAIRAIVACALSKDPVHRFKSAHEMRVALIEASSSLRHAEPKPAEKTHRDSSVLAATPDRTALSGFDLGIAEDKPRAAPVVPPAVTAPHLPPLPANPPAIPGGSGSQRMDLPNMPTVPGARQSMEPPSLPGSTRQSMEPPSVPSVSSRQSMEPPSIPSDAGQRSLDPPAPPPLPGGGGRQSIEPPTPPPLPGDSARHSAEASQRFSFWPFSKNPPPFRMHEADGAELSWIAPGEFTMGDGDLIDNPRRRIALDGFWIYRHPVTVAMYRRFCASAQHAMPDPPPWGWIDDHPMVNVRWQDAVDYCKWARVSLPTEVQWEKAARGTDARKFPWGANWDPTRCYCSRSNYADARSTVMVGAHPTGASPYGVMDMAGNVWEWCHETIEGGSHNSDIAAGPRRVLRGGSWEGNLPGEFRTSFRQRQFPSYMYYTIGFRCVLNGETP